MVIYLHNAECYGNSTTFLRHARSLTIHSEHLYEVPSTHDVALVAYVCEIPKGVANTLVVLAKRRSVVKVQLHELLEVYLRHRAPQVNLIFSFYQQIFDLGKFKCTKIFCRKT